ncbi:MAG: hypothetical protein QNK90_09360, partial [Opitutaceae bacterium]
LWDLHGVADEGDASQSRMDVVPGARLQHRLDFLQRDKLDLRPFGKRLMCPIGSAQSREQDGRKQ